MCAVVMFGLWISLNWLRSELYVVNCSNDSPVLYHHEHHFAWFRPAVCISLVVSPMIGQGQNCAW